MGQIIYVLLKQKKQTIKPSRQRHFARIQGSAESTAGTKMLARPLTC